MHQTAARIFGLFFIIAGVAGFIEPLAPEGMLFGLFMVGPVHNVIHLLSGVAAMVCAMAGAGASRRYLQIFGVIYGLVALLGFVYGNEALLGLVEHNMHDIWLHIVIAGAALILGFGVKPGTSNEE